MSETEVPANKFLSLTDSKICGFCEAILAGVDGWASNPATQGEPNKQAHGSLRLGELGNRAATCHLCALFLSLFDHNEQRELEEAEVTVGSEWSTGTLRALFIGKKSLNVRQDSEYKPSTPMTLD
jgi:hypothetical protein